MGNDSSFYEYVSINCFNTNRIIADRYVDFIYNFQAAREVIRQYLLKFRLTATDIYEESCKSEEDLNRMPTLLEILHHMEPLKYEIETIASIYKRIDAGMYFKTPFLIFALVQPPNYAIDQVEIRQGKYKLTQTKSRVKS